MQLFSFSPNSTPSESEVIFISPANGMVSGFSCEVNYSNLENDVVVDLLKNDQIISSITFPKIFKSFSGKITSVESTAVSIGDEFKLLVSNIENFSLINTTFEVEVI